MSVSKGGLFGIYEIKKNLNVIIQRPYVILIQWYAKRRDKKNRVRYILLEDMKKTPEKTRWSKASENKTLSQGPLNGTFSEKKKFTYILWYGGGGSVIFEKGLLSVIYGIFCIAC